MKNDTFTKEDIFQLFDKMSERMEERLEKQRLEFDREMAQRAKEREELDAKLKKERDELDAYLKKEREERDAYLQKERAERERQQAERDKHLAELNADYIEGRKAFAIEYEKEVKAFKAQQKITDKKLAEIGDTLGRFAEEQVRPKAVKMFQKLGIPIYDIYHNAKKGSPDNQVRYEIDILLYNTDYVVGIEVKSTLRLEHIEEHLERLELMRQFPFKGVIGTKIIGAVAAMNADESIINNAIKNGLYVIMPNGKSVGLKNVKEFKPRLWVV